MKETNKRVVKSFQRNKKKIFWIKQLKADTV